MLASDGMDFETLIRQLNYEIDQVVVDAAVAFSIKFQQYLQMQGRLQAAWPVKSCQMSIKVATKWFYTFTKIV